MRIDRGQLFPVGLYGLLLGALCWLALPRATAPIERTVLGVAALPLRVYAGFRGTPAQAAAVDGHADRALVDELLQRQADSALRGGRELVPASLHPVHCRVLEVRRRGGGGWLAELVLDRSYRELADCRAFVTRGDSLLGFLARPGNGPAEDDGLDDPARVLLLHHPDARQVAASMPLSDSGAGRLRFVVEPAGAVDIAPLRCVLWDDPYLASRVGEKDQPVRTEALLRTPERIAVPAGLLIGRSKPWGYGKDDAVLTIGLYVEPDHRPRTVTNVVLWRAAAGAAPSEPRAAKRLQAARLLPLRGPDGDRWYLHAANAVIPDGAALIAGERFLGTVRGLRFGQGLVTPLPATHGPLSLVFLPLAQERPPVDLRAEIAFAAPGEVWLRALAASDPVPIEVIGHLFTGVGGRHFPSGLLLGPARREANGLLRLSWSELGNASSVAVFVGEGGP